MIPRVSAPIAEPMIEPRPPIRLVPPSTTAVMTSSSNAVPELDEPLASRVAVSDAGERGEQPGERERGQLDPADVDAGAAQRLARWSRRRRRSGRSGSG